jgi:hypothetical protein
METLKKSRRDLMTLIAKLAKILFNWSQQYLFKLTEFVLVWACFNPSGILNQPEPHHPAEYVTSVQSVTLSMVRQYAVWYQHATPRTRGRFPMMVIHHTHHLFTSFQHSSLDGAQVGSH